MFLRIKGKAININIYEIDNLKDKNRNKKLDTNMMLLSESISFNFSKEKIDNINIHESSDDNYFIKNYNKCLKIQEVKYIDEMIEINKDKYLLIDIEYFDYASIPFLCKNKEKIISATQYDYSRLTDNILEETFLTNIIIDDKKIELNKDYLKMIKPSVKNLKLKTYIIKYDEDSDLFHIES